MGRSCIDQRIPRKCVLMHARPLIQWLKNRETLLLQAQERLLSGRHTMKAATFVLLAAVPAALALR